MLIIHHLDNSRSQRILWLLEELNLEYKIETYKRVKKSLRAPKELKAIHPLGKAPVLQHNSTTMAESGAIIDYILRHFDKNNSLYPIMSSSDYDQFIFWLHYAEGSVMPPLVVKLITAMLKSKSVPLLVRAFTGLIAAGIDKNYTDPQIKDHFDFIDQHLSKNTFFIGNHFSAADIQMSFPLEAAMDRAVQKNQYKNIENFLKRIHSRPAYIRAIEKGGDYIYNK